MKKELVALFMFISYVYGVLIGAYVVVIDVSFWVSFLLGVPMGIFLFAVYVKMDKY